MIVFISLLGLALRLLNLNQSFWLDEAAQLVESARPFNQQLNIAGDFQPPLFHLLLHFWLLLGHGEIWVRLLPILCGVASIWLLYILTKTIATQKVAALSALLFAIAPFHIWYSQEVRPYALSVLLALVCTYFLFKKNWRGYTISALFFVYTIYLAPFLLLAHGVYVFWFEKKALRRWLISTLIIIAGFLPWLPSFWQQLAIGKGLTSALPGWSEAVSTPLSKALPLVFIKFLLGRITFDNKFLYGLISVILLLFSSWLLLIVFKSRRSLFLRLGSLALIPILAAFIVSVFLPILAPQRVLFTLPFFIILFSFGILQLKRYWLIPLGVFILSNSMSIFLYSNPRFQREQWRQAVAFVEEERTASSKVIFVFPDSFAPWQWYNHGIVQSLAVAPNLTVNAATLSNFTLQLFGIDRIFYFHYLTELTDPNKQTQKFIENLGYYEVGLKDFPGVGFISVYEKAVAYH